LEVDVPPILGFFHRLVGPLRSGEPAEPWVSPHQNLVCAKAAALYIILDFQLFWHGPSPRPKVLLRPGPLSPFRHFFSPPKFLPFFPGGSGTGAGKCPLGAFPFFPIQFERFFFPLLLPTVPLFLPVRDWYLSYCFLAVCFRNFSFPSPFPVLFFVASSTVCLSFAQSSPSVIWLNQQEVTGHTGSSGSPSQAIFPVSVPGVPPQVRPTLSGFRGCRSLTP